jgi:predicted SAM-dependent methyltransferase
MLTDLLKWGARRPDQPGSEADPAALRADEPLTTSKAFTKFLSVLSQQPAPVLVDFGPVIGGNVEFFGEQLGCKLFIEDIFADLDRHTRAGTLDVLASGFATRFAHEDGSVDGVLCWDCFDFLDKASVQALAREIVRLVRPGGIVMGMFCTSSVERTGYTKYEIVDQKNLRYRQHPGIGGARHALQNRDISRMFQGLNVSDSFLLKNNTREMLFRRP